MQQGLMISALPSHLKWLLCGAALLRMVMIIFGEWQDRNMEVKYTDVDYVVFTDAARFVWNGTSPYERYTYRYTPLLAYVLVPNIFLHRCWGKLLFSAADLLVGYQIFAILRLKRIGEASSSWCAATWLFNPFTFTVATRGSCDALVGAMLLQMLFCLIKGRIIEGALWYGLSVHFRIYPIIFAFSILLLLNNDYAAFFQKKENKAKSSDTWRSSSGQTSSHVTGNSSEANIGRGDLHRTPPSRDLPENPSKDTAASVNAGESASCHSQRPLSENLGLARTDARKVDNCNKEGLLTKYKAPNSMAEQPTTAGGPRPQLGALIWQQISWERVVFSLASGGCFLLLSGGFFALYRWQFLNEALLYHLTRTDPRHNFSIYFYQVYLSIEKAPSVADRLAAFLPQLGLQLFLSARFARDLPFCVFIQTVAFVAFNKVITAQYFVWFFCLLPLAIPMSSLGWKHGAGCVAVWVAAQLHWLGWAYLLEFEGRNVFAFLWLASLTFFAVSVCTLTVIVRYNRFAPLFTPQAEKEEKDL